MKKRRNGANLPKKPSCQYKESNVEELASGDYMGHVICFAFLLGIAVAMGSGIYVNAGQKFVRVRSNEEYCGQSWINIYSPESTPICCPKEVPANNTVSGVCHHSSATYAKVTASLWGSWLIPLLPFVLNTYFQSQAPEEEMPQRTKFHMRRLILYVAIILGRTFILYLAVDNCEKFVQGPESTDCWYAHMRLNSRCKDNFDGSDHVVLFMCQFLAVQMMEMYAIFQEAQNLTMKKWILAIISAIISMLSLNGIYGTTAYFHSIKESLVGFGMSLLVHIPLCVIMINPIKNQISGHLTAKFYINFKKHYQHK